MINSMLVLFTVAILAQANTMLLFQEIAARAAFNPTEKVKTLFAGVSLPKEKVKNFPVLHLYLTAVKQTGSVKALAILVWVLATQKTLVEGHDLWEFRCQVLSLIDKDFDWSAIAEHGEDLVTFVETVTGFFELSEETVRGFSVDYPKGTQPVILRDTLVNIALAVFEKKDEAVVKKLLASMQWVNNVGFIPVVAQHLRLLEFPEKTEGMSKKEEKALLWKQKVESRLIAHAGSIGTVMEDLLNFEEASFFVPIGGIVCSALVDNVNANVVAELKTSFGGNSDSHLNPRNALQMTVLFFLHAKLEFIVAVPDYTKENGLITHNKTDELFKKFPLEDMRVALKEAARLILIHYTTLVPA